MLKQIDVLNNRIGPRWQWLQIVWHVWESILSVNSMLWRCGKVPSLLLVFKPCENTFWKQMILIKQRGTDLETQLLEIRHKSRLKFFYLGLPNFTSNPCGLPLTRDCEKLGEELIRHSTMFRESCGLVTVSPGICIVVCELLQTMSLHYEP